MRINQKGINLLAKCKGSHKTIDELFTCNSCNVLFDKKYCSHSRVSPNYEGDVYCHDCKEAISERDLKPEKTDHERMKAFIDEIIMVEINESGLDPDVAFEDPELISNAIDYVINLAMKYAEENGI